MKSIKKQIATLLLLVAPFAQAETLTVGGYLTSCNEADGSELQWGVCAATKISGWQSAQIALLGMDKCAEYEFYTPNMAHAKLAAEVTQGNVDKDLMVMAAFITVIASDITCLKPKTTN